MLPSKFVFGYHGCDESVVQMVLEGGHLRPSQNAYDWLGHGVYFWEDSPARAMRLATEMQTAGAPVGKPAVLGAIIDTGHCLNLIDPENASLVISAHSDYVELCRGIGVAPSQNKGPESKARFLDCSVMNLLHQLREKEGHRPFDTVRGFFIEGQPLYPTAGLRSLDHVQLCVRHPQSIVGFFLPNTMR